MAITKEMKQKLFDKLLWLEQMAQEQQAGKLYDHRDYYSESEGAYQMIELLGLGKEYMHWSTDILYPEFTEKGA